MKVYRHVLHLILLFMLVTCEYLRNQPACHDIGVDKDSQDKDLLPLIALIFAD